MTGSTEPEPPLDLPTEFVAQIEALDPHQLRETIVYAQQLFAVREHPANNIEPLPGEEIVRIEDHGEYTEVVKRQSCPEGCDRCPHGPYLYHVTTERHPDGETSLHWQFIGQVKE